LKAPEGLRKAGKALWDAIQGHYNISDAGGIVLLHQAALALDRAEDCAAAVAKEGVVISTPRGLRDNPGVKYELQNRAFLVRTLKELGVTVESVKPVGRPGMGGWSGGC